MSSNLTISLISIGLLFCVSSKASDKPSEQCQSNKKMDIAIAALCNEKTKCLDSQSYNYVCMKDLNESFSNYCGTLNLLLWGVECIANSSNSANSVLQCHTHSSFIESERLMLCLRRTDQNKDLFKQALYKSHGSKRINFFDLIDLKDNKLICNGLGNYSVTHIFTPWVGGNHQCEFNNKDVVDIVQSGIKSDFSFWHGEGRCVKDVDEDYVYSKAMLCNKNCIKHKYRKCPTKEEVEEECNQKENGFYCEKSEMCISKGDTCDGIFHCLHGEDELFELCEPVFPEIATIKCIENRAEGIDLTILAVPCDGTIECRDGSDEDCETNNAILYSSMTLFLFLTIFLWCGIRYDVRKYSSRHKPSIKQDGDILDYQSLKGDKLAQLKESTSQKDCAEKLKNEDIFSRLKDIYEKTFFNDYVGCLTNPLKIITSQLDFIKDVLLARVLNKLIGGFSFRKLHLFSANIVLLLVLTIFIPQQLAALRLASNLPQDLHVSKKITFTLLLLIGAPLLMYYHKLEFMHIDEKSKVNPKDEANNLKWAKKKQVMSSHVKLELGLETIYQLAGQFILLGLAYTDTATNESFPILFKKENIFFLVASTVYSFISCVNSHLTAISACRERFPFKSKMVAAAYSFCGCTTRVLALVMYFAVPLGLFNLLRHLQGEQYPWHPDLVYNFVGPNATGTISVGKEIIEWADIDRWNKNFSVEPFKVTWKATWNDGFLLSPPDYTLYTYFRLGQFFALFLTHLFLHIIIIYIAKYRLSKFFREKFNFIEKVIHCIENTNIPYNAQEWDDGKGDARRHRLRMAANLKEVYIVIAIKTVMNAILLIPLAYLVYKIQERNTFLWNTIGFLDKEYEALKTGYVLLGVSVFWIIAGGFAEAYFFSLYNGKFHPFASILLDPEPEEIPLTEVKTEQSSKRSENIVEENKEDDYKEIDSKEIDSKEINSTEIDSKEINSKKIDSKEIDSKKIDSKKIDAKEIDAKEINAKEIDSNEIVAKKIDANEIYAKEIDINDEINELEPMLEGEAKTEKKTKDQE